MNDNRPDKMIRNLKSPVMIPASGFIFACRKTIGWLTLFVLMMAVVCGCAGTLAPLYSEPAAGQRESCAVPQCSRGDVPGRIILNLTAAPATSQAVTWRTHHPVAEPRAQIAPASGSVSFDENAWSVEAHSQTVSLDNGTAVVHHAVVFEGLEPDTLYAYRVGAEDSWSEWNQFKTASRGPAPFSFVYFGDPQVEIRSKCSRVFRAAYRKAPDAHFWHFVGDLVDDGDRDEQWGELFDAFGWISRTTPMILLPGNHEYPNRRKVKDSDYQLYHLWRAALYPARERTGRARGDRLHH